MTTRFYPGAPGDIAEAARRIYRLLEQEGAARPARARRTQSAASPHMPMRDPGSTRTHGGADPGIWPFGQEGEPLRRPTSSLTQLHGGAFGLLDALLRPEAVRSSTDLATDDRSAEGRDVAQNVVPGPWCLLTDEQDEIWHKSCVYRCPGGEKVITVGYGEDCPTRVRSDDPRLRDDPWMLVPAPVPRLGGGFGGGGGGGGRGGGGK